MLEQQPHLTRSQPSSLGHLLALELRVGEVAGDGHQQIDLALFMAVRLPVEGIDHQADGLEGPAGLFENLALEGFHDGLIGLEVAADEIPAAGEECTLLAAALHEDAARVVRDHHFDLVYVAYLGDARVREVLETNNPAAAREIAERLLEASDRGLWRPRRNATRAELEALAAGEERITP